MVLYTELHRGPQAITISNGASIIIIAMAMCCGCGCRERTSTNISWGTTPFPSCGSITTTSSRAVEHVFCKRCSTGNGGFHPTLLPFSPSRPPGWNGYRKIFQSGAPPFFPPPLGDLPPLTDAGHCLKVIDPRHLLVVPGRGRASRQPGRSQSRGRDLILWNPPLKNKQQQLPETLSPCPPLSPLLLLVSGMVQ